MILMMNYCSHYRFHHCWYFRWWKDCASFYFFDCESSVDPWTYRFFGCCVPCDDDDGSLQMMMTMTTRCYQMSFQRRNPTLVLSVPWRMEDWGCETTRELFYRWTGRAPSVAT
jgi:hypothetical protein